MRVAYYGLSSPIFYDYSVKAQKTDHDISSSPNPILENAWGAMILCDELWFFCKSLCPKNLRDKPFIKYLTNAELHRIIPLYDSQRYNSIVGEKQDIDKRNKKLQKQVGTYREIVKSTGVLWGNARPDNHTHTLNVYGQDFSANSLSIPNILFDFKVVEFLNSIHSHDIELVTNSFTQAWLDSNDRVLAELRFSETMVIEYIPNYLKRNGPYDEGILQFREDRFVKDFRQWVSDLRLSPNISTKEIREMKKEFENQMLIIMAQERMKYLGTPTYYSVCKNIIDEVIGVVPGVSVVKRAASIVNEHEDRERNRWQAFLLSQKLKHIKSA